VPRNSTDRPRDSPVSPMSRSSCKTRGGVAGNMPATACHNGPMCRSAACSFLPQLPPVSPKTPTRCCLPLGVHPLDSSCPLCCSPNPSTCQEYKPPLVLELSSSFFSSSSSSIPSRAFISISQCSRCREANVVHRPSVTICSYSPSPYFSTPLAQ